MMDKCSCESFKFDYVNLLPEYFYMQAIASSLAKVSDISYEFLMILWDLSTVETCHYTEPLVVINGKLLFLII